MQQDLVVVRRLVRYRGVPPSQTMCVDHEDEQGGRMKRLRKDTNGRETGRVRKGLGLAIA